MGRVSEKAKATRDALKAQVNQVETRVLAAEGRRSLKAKARTTAKVVRKATKAGVAVGIATAVGVVVREVRKRRALNA